MNLIQQKEKGLSSSQSLQLINKDATSNWYISLFSLATFFLGWSLVAVSGLLELPTPWLTFKVFIELCFQGDALYNRTLPSIVLESLLVVFKGCLLAFIVAVPLGIIMGSLPSLRKYFDTMVELLRPIPPLAWIPLAYVFFAKVDNPTAYVQQFIVFTGAFFPALTNTTHGVKMIDKIYFEAAYTMGATRSQIFLSILLPGALPAILAGIRIGLGIGWMCIVAAEFVGGEMGIGYYIWSCYSVGGRVPEIISGIAAIGIVGSLFNSSILFLEKKVVSWR